MDHRLLMMLYQLQKLFSIECYERIIIFNELDRIMEEAFVVCFKALYQHSPEGTGKNYKET
jgi:hypothetical protein